jgi:asparagine synthase (glutamine-hydrolysing)
MVLRETADPAASTNVIQEMISALSHRGPDDSGVWIDPRSCVALGHRRLSIIDLSPSGHQPMLSSDGRYAITYNGELYNYKTLRAQLDGMGTGVNWRSESDTEVVLEAIRILGLQSALRLFVGMFAFALWDCAKRELHLARDRLGEKPLYYGWVGSAFCFASEIKALQRVSGWEGELDKESVGLYFRYGFVPAPSSIFKNIKKLEPGSYLTLSTVDIRSREIPKRNRYWEIPAAASSLLVQPFKHGYKDLVTVLERLMIQSVGRQLVADVPVGAFLSGGIDSSSVVAIAQELSSRRVQTYTVSFHEQAYSEGQYARAVAQHLGTDHTELYVTAVDAIEVVPDLPTIYDEPMSDPSQIPTYLVSKLASRYVKVCLSGDGGDEMFGGYNRHIWGSRLPRWFSCLPADRRKRLVAIVLNYLGGKGYSAIGRLQKLGDALAAADARESYMALITHWKGDEQLFVSDCDTTSVSPPWDTSTDPRRAMMRADSLWYLPDDILVKLDRASMAVSLETRVPFLDHDLVEFASQIPVNANIGLMTGKRLLRQVLHKRVPAHLVDRPKMGFGLPIDQWLRGPLRDWVEHLISPIQLAHHGLLRETVVDEKWRQHLSCTRDWSTQLWDVLTFQAWYERYVRK